MEAQRFDHFSRLLGHATGRRLFVGLSLSPLAGLVARPAKGAEAQKTRKKRKKHKKPQPNAYGCLDVDQSCNGDSSNCCSGVCDGEKPKKGKKDTSRCVAHDAGICQADFDICSTGSPHYCNASNPNCTCVLTTGNAGFCGDFSLGLDNLCHACSQDTDCEDEFGPGAACIVTGGICEPVCTTTGGTACIPACKDPKQ
jgi:hypothetical protein